MPYIAGIDPGGKFFTDQSGKPILFACEDNWSLVVSAGRWTSGAWQADISAYLASRAAQGYNAVEVSAFSVPSLTGAAFTDSRDYDGVYPFTSTNDPSSGLNNSFWLKRDYLIDQALLAGITPVISLTGPMGTGSIVTSWTGTQWTAYGAAIASRYASRPNILWICGDDYFGAQDAGFALMLAALRAGGDAHPISLQNASETTSRYAYNPTHSADPNAFGEQAQYDWVYTYNPSYNGVTYAQQSEPSVSDVHGRIPVLWADGFYLASGTAGGQTDVRLERQLIWWALASGAVGFSTGDNDIWVWGSGSAAQVTGKSFYTQVVPAILAAYLALPGWHTLVSDWASALVTSGRGTPAADVSSGSVGYTANTDSYVSAARAPDGSLALIYCAQAFSVTVDQSKLAAGYKGMWIDPVSGAGYRAATGGSYNSGATDGPKPVLNSAGDPDWALALIGPPVTPGAPPAIRRGGSSRTVEAYRAVR